MNRLGRAPHWRWAAPLVLALVAGCAAPASEARSLVLHTLNGSGVSGTVTLTGVDASRTLVEVEVDPAGHPDMPAHIHPGTCDDLTPQPEFPLQNIVDGRSTTELRVPLDELFSSAVALNVHASNDDMQTYTACVDLQ